jgi:anti-sigma factor RsiW
MCGCQSERGFGMKCPSSRHLLELHLDGELSAGESAEIEEHIENCASCDGLYSRLEQLQSDIRKQITRHTAPAQLQRSIQVALRRAAAAEPEPPRMRWNWMAVAASFLLFASLALNIASLRSRDSAARDGLAQEVLSSHLRSLMGTHLLDVPSSDQHTVKPWFNGKLSFSPDVKDFSSQGFPLIGGRVEYIGERPVAALVYQRRQHFINLFTWPSSSASQSGYSEMKRSGYNLVSWTEDGMTCWAVSDLQTGELEQFAQLYK